MSDYNQTLIDLRALVILAIASEGNVGSNVFGEGGVPVNQEPPYVVISRTSEDQTTWRTHEQSATGEDLDITLGIFSHDRNQLQTLEDLLRAYFSGLKVTQGSTNFAAVHLVDSNYFYEGDPRIHVQEIDFLVQVTN